MHRLILVALGLFACTIAASAGYQGKAKDDVVYFPQQVGNEYVYRKTGRIVGEGAGWTNRISEKKGKLFLHSNFWGDNTARWLRINANGQVVEKPGRKSEGKGGKFVWYSFAAAINEQQVMRLASGGPPCADGARTRIVSASETVEVPAGTFTNVVKFEFDHNCNDAGIEEQWFAPGVGLIKQTEQSIAGPVVAELVSAKVGDKVFPQR